MSETPFVRAADIAWIESRLRWRMAPVLTLAAILTGLLFAALLPRVAPPPRVAGLVGGDEARQAADLLAGRLVLPPAGLRLSTALAGEAIPGGRPARDLGDRLDRAASLLRRTAATHARDARLGAAFAVLDLARHQYAAAERRYRGALDRAPRFAEARLGLGVTLALAADVERDPLLARRLRLQAIAQFAAVTPEDAEHAAALFNRAMLLAEVGRHAEAREIAERYLAIDAAGPWAERIRARVLAS